MLVINALQSVLSIMIMVSIGYLLSKKKWLDKKTSNLFSKLIVNISLPSVMIYNLMTSFNKVELLDTLGGIIVPFLGILITYIISIPLAKLLKIREDRRGMFSALFAFANTIFIGLPVNVALFGEASIPYVILYYIANTTIFWTIGIYGIKKDGEFGKDIKSDNKLISFSTAKRIFSPILASYVLSIILILLEINLPKFILDTCRYLGNLTTPLSMLIIGTIIYSINLKELKFDKDMLAITLGRFIITPLFVFVMLRFFPVAKLLMGKVFILEAAMPAMTTIAIVGQAYDADNEYATVKITMTILISLFVIPIYMYLISFM